MKILKWTLCIVASIIMLQTLYFKFTGHPESIYIFKSIGLEPYGRIGSGIVEFVASIFLLIPMFRIYGAILGFGVLSGAIFFHLTSLGIDVQGDGGLLFFYALAVFFCCLLILIFERHQIPFIGKKFSNQ